MISEKLKELLYGIARGGFAMGMDPKNKFRPEGMVLWNEKAIEAGIAEYVAELMKAKDCEIAIINRRLAEAKAAALTSEHRPFDEAAARAGEAIEWQDSPGKWHVVEFVGVWKDKVLFSHEGNGPEEWPKGRVRMAPRPMRTVWVIANHEGNGSVRGTEAAAKELSETFFNLCVNAFPVQVPSK